MIITKQWLLNYRSHKGGWTQTQLEAIDVDWPPLKGWMSAIDGKVITRKQQRIFEDGWCLRTKKRKAYSVKKKDNWKVRLCAMPSKQFYRTKTWFKLRRRVLEEYGYRCMLCGSLDDIQVDHIRPRSREPHLSLEFSNLQVLCKDCNREKSNIHAEDYREEAAMIELDRQAYLDALDRGL